MYSHERVLQFDDNNVSVEFCEGQALFCVSDFEEIFGTRLADILPNDEIFFGRMEYINAGWLQDLAQNSNYPRLKELRQWINSVVLPEACKPISMFKHDVLRNKQSVASQMCITRGGEHAIKNEAAGYAIYLRTSEHFKNK